MTTRAGNASGADADVDPSDGRDESEDERMDRNWNELLQELRVTQTGTQIFSGFLLTIAFQSTFAHLTRFQHGVYLGLVLIAAAVTVLGLAPVNLHRGLFRTHQKALLVKVAHRILRAALAGVALIVVGVVLLVVDVIATRSWALLAAGGTVALIGVVAVLPLLLRNQRPRP